jgi:hypothetical protein
MVDVLDVIFEEQKSLREEIHQLKGCQIQYFTLSVTGTAGLFGASSLFGVSSIKDSLNAQAIFFLIPLVIILPCWWIFFDKATTITRIVGYQRLLDKILLSGKEMLNWFIGYEKALAMYRRRDDEKIHQHVCYSKFKSSTDGVQPESKQWTRHKYWMINWLTFALLSLFCCVVAVVFTIHTNSLLAIIVTAIGICFYLFTAIITFITMKMITEGKYSYNENSTFWKFILDPERRDTPVEHLTCEDSAGAQRRK